MCRRICWRRRSAIARELEAEIAAALADGGRGERLREGLVVAIAGPPNAGKSTLLNRIARREAAIVSPYAGTTRDVIEVHLDLGGWPVTLLDTAGIRDTDDPVELEGVRRARERAAGADLVLWVVDAGERMLQKMLQQRVQQNRPLRLGHSAGALRSRSPMRLRRNRSEPGFRRPGYEALGPSIWLIRNKIDLIKAVGTRNEPRIQVSVKSEAEFDPNKPLRNMVNKGLTHKK